MTLHHFNVTRITTGQVCVRADNAEEAKYKLINHASQLDDDDFWCFITKSTQTTDAELLGQLTVDDVFSSGKYPGLHASVYDEDMYKLNVDAFKQSMTYFSAMNFVVQTGMSAVHESGVTMKMAHQYAGDFSLEFSLNGQLLSSVPANVLTNEKKWTPLDE